MSKERVMEWTGAAMWLPLVFGALLLSGKAHAQTSGVAPLMSGDCTVSATGVAVCTKSNGVAFQASATTDTTNAANISSGTLPAGRMCSGTASAYYYCDRSTGAWAAIGSVPAVSSAVAITGGSIDGTVVGSTTPTLGIFTIIQANTRVSLQTQTAATAGANANSPSARWVGAYWNGTASALDTWSVVSTLGAGTNGTSTLNVTHSGSSGVATVSLPALDGTPIGANTRSTGAFTTVSATGLIASPRLSASSTTGNGFNQPLYTPASSSAACTAGDFADDASFHYVCVATNSWKRAALSAF